MRVKYPFENGLGDLPREEAFECLADYTETFFRREKGELPAPADFAAWMEYRFGKAIARKYLYPYNRKIWDYPPEKMDTFWVEGRIPQPPLRDVMRAAMNLSSEGYQHQLNFHYPKRGGIQAVTDSIAARLGKRLRSGFAVEKVRKEDGRWIVSGQHGGKRTERAYERLVNTLHIQDFIRAYPDTPQEVREAAKKLRWNSVHLVMLGRKSDKPEPLHWAYIPDAGILPNRISFPSNLSETSAPARRSSILAETTFSPDGEKARMPEKEVVSRTIEGLESIGILRSADITFTKLVSCRYAYVVYDLGYRKNMETVRSFASREGISLLGRWGKFSYHNSDKCVENAMALARSFPKHAPEAVKNRR